MIRTLETTVAFSGNRNMIPPPDLVIDDLEGVIRSNLSALLLKLYHSGKRRFLSGGAVGFDTLAAEQVVQLRREFNDVELIIVVPFVGQQTKYPQHERERYEALIATADEVEIISEGFSLGAYHQRNEFMVKNCSTLVCYSSGSGNGRGTISTIRRAMKHNVEVINIYETLFKVPNAKQLSLEL